MALYIEAGYDLADLSGGYVLDVVETGGNTFTVTMASGTYFLRTDAATATGDFSALVTGHDDFLGDLKSNLDAGGSGGVYTVSFSVSTERVTITHDGGAGVTAISLTPTTNGGVIGHTAVKSGALSHALDRTPDYWISGSIGFWSEYREAEENEQVAFGAIAHSGRPHSIAKDGVATLLDLVVPLEEQAKVYTDHATVADPWTWQALYRHCRSTEPLAIDDGTFVHFVRLHESHAAFAPRNITRDYVGHYDIPLRTRLLARI